MNAAAQVATVDGKSPEHRDDFVDILLRQPAEDGTGRLSDISIKALIQVHGEKKKNLPILIQTCSSDCTARASQSLLAAGYAILLQF